MIGVLIEGLYDTWASGCNTTNERSEAIDSLQAADVLICPTQ